MISKFIDWLSSLMPNLYVEWIGAITFAAAGAILGYVYKLYKSQRDLSRERKLQEEVLGLIKTYSSRREAVQHQIVELAHASQIDFLAYNGFALLDDPVFVETSFFQILKKWDRAGTKTIRILLLNPQEKEVILERLKRIDSADIRPTEVEVNSDVADIMRNGDRFLSVGKDYPSVKIDLGFFSSDLIWCILIFEKRIIWSFYQEGTTASHARTLLVDRSSLIGKSLVYYFEDMWKRRIEGPE